MKTREQQLEYYRQYYHDNKLECNERKKRRLLRRRTEIINKLGGKCKCGTVEKLQLHHKYYAKDSIRPSQKESGWISDSRVSEALKHPERFKLLCLPCHNSTRKGCSYAKVDGGERKSE